MCLRKFREVRKDLGEPPLVTPVLSDRRYTGCIQCHHGRALQDGYQGDKGCVSAVSTEQTVKPFNKEVQKKCIGDAEVITCRPADLLKPELETLEEEMAQYKAAADEDVLSYALFPQVATDFFKYREAQQTKVDPTKADTKDKAYPV